MVHYFNNTICYLLLLLIDNLRESSYEPFFFSLSIFLIVAFKESLDEVTIKDTLDGDNMYTCSQCGKKVRAEKR